MQPDSEHALKHYLKGPQGPFFMCIVEGSPHSDLVCLAIKEEKIPANYLLLASQLNCCVQEVRDADLEPVAMFFQCWLVKANMTAM